MGFLAYLVGFADDFVINVGDVHHICDRDLKMPGEYSFDDVKVDV
jgi:hypothetical protein